MTNTSRSSGRDLYELPLLAIKKLEVQTFNLFNETVLAPLAPHIVAQPYSTAHRDTHGMGGMNARVFINNYPTLKLRVFAGKKDGVDIRTVRINPITADDFPDSYNKAVNRYRTGKTFDFARSGQYQKINELIDCYQVMFKGDFDKSPLDFHTHQSKDYTTYMRNRDKVDIDILDKKPSRHHHYVDADLSGFDFKNRASEQNRPALANMRHVQTSLYWFGNKVDFVEEICDELYHKYNAVRPLVR